MKASTTRALRALIVSLAGMGLGTWAEALTPAEVYAKVSPSVWKVLTYDVDGLPLSQGSAVVVGEQSLVTNCHVLRKAKRVVVRRETTTVTATLEMWDPQRDLCQLRAPGFAAPVVELGAASRLTVGQEVYAVGNPKGLDLTMSAGLISSFRRDDKQRLLLIQTSAAISGGSSGGGLFDADGALVGLTTIGSVGADTQNLNFAIPVDWIRELPERHARLTSPTGTANAAPAAPATQTPASSTSQAAKPVVPGPPGAYAAIDDDTRLPFSNERMRASYRIFLSQPMPRAFAISEGGAFQVASGLYGASAGEHGDPAWRALKQCERYGRGACFVYAVNDRVIYKPSDYVSN
jgi:serine protease Do